MPMAQHGVFLVPQAVPHAAPQSSGAPLGASAGRAEGTPSGPVGAVTVPASAAPAGAAVVAETVMTEVEVAANSSSDESPRSAKRKHSSHAPAPAAAAAARVAKVKVVAGGVHPALAGGAGAAGDTYDAAYDPEPVEAVVTLAPIARGGPNSAAGAGRTATVAAGWEQQQHQGGPVAYGDMHQGGGGAGAYHHYGMAHAQDGAGQPAAGVAFGGWMQPQGMMNSMVMAGTPVQTMMPRYGGLPYA